MIITLKTQTSRLLSQIQVPYGKIIPARIVELINYKISGIFLFPEAKYLRCGEYYLKINKLGIPNPHFIGRSGAEMKKNH